jgi:hypothetical protein
MAQQAAFENKLQTKRRVAKQKTTLLKRYSNDCKIQNIVGCYKNVLPKHCTNIKNLANKRYRI